MTRHGLGRLHIIFGGVKVLGHVSDLVNVVLQLIAFDR